jgi:hypothetical protein
VRNCIVGLLRMKPGRFAVAAGIVCLFALQLDGQDTAELLARIKAMEDRINALESEVRTLQGQPQAAVVQPPAAAPVEVAGPAPSVQQSIGGAAGAAAKALNPDISLLGNFLGAAGNPAGHPSSSLEMKESELGIQAIVDPYARADVFLSFGEQGVNLEEGYLTFTSLPGALQLRVGKMRAAFGKVNTLHTHVLPWTDRPLVTMNLLAGEDGISDAGLSLSRTLPAPKNIFLEGTAQVFRGDTPGLFQAARRSDVSTVGHLRAFRDITESTNLDLGFSYARGHSPLADGANQVYGIDATLRWKPLRRAIYHSFVARSEFMWGRAQGERIPAVFPVLEPSQKSFGYYISTDYQLARRWFLGGRFDRSDRLLTPQLTDTGGSILLTYWPSEFIQIRGQLRRTGYAENLTANELLFQLQFSLGAHGAHPF